MNTTLHTYPVENITPLDFSKNPIVEAIEDLSIISQEKLIRQSLEDIALAVQQSTQELLKEPVLSLDSSSNNYLMARSGIELIQLSKTIQSEYKKYINLSKTAPKLMSQIKIFDEISHKTMGALNSRDSQLLESVPVISTGIRIIAILAEDKQNMLNLSKRLSDLRNMQELVLADMSRRGEEYLEQQLPT